MRVHYSNITVSDIRGKLIRNPNYGGPTVGPFGWVCRQKVSTANKPKFHQALVESIQEEGIRNPVLVWSFDEGIFLTFGGSRVRAAQEAGLTEIPCIVNDITGCFQDCPEVTEDNWEGFFTDIPRYAEFTERGFDYHYSIERARRHNYDPSGFAWVGDNFTFIDEFPWLEEDNY